MAQGEPGRLGGNWERTRRLQRLSLFSLFQFLSTAGTGRVAWPCDEMPEGTWRVNFRENLVEESLIVIPTYAYGTEFSREFSAVKRCLHDDCHPSVTHGAHEKGCKRPVHRRSVTLAPLNPNKSIDDYDQLR